MTMVPSKTVPPRDKPLQPPFLQGRSTPVTPPLHLMAPVDNVNLSESGLSDTGVTVYLKYEIRTYRGFKLLLWRSTRLLNFLF